MCHDKDMRLVMKSWEEKGQRTRTRKEEREREREGETLKGEHVRAEAQ